MKTTITVSAKKVEDAIREGLEKLGVSMEEAEVKILSSGGLFKKAQVEITVGTDDAPAAAVVKPEIKPAPQEKPVFTKSAANSAPQEKPAFTKSAAKPAPQEKPAVTKSAAKPAPQEKPSVEPRASTVEKPAGLFGNRPAPAESAAPAAAKPAAKKQDRPQGARPSGDGKKREKKRHEDEHVPATAEMAQKAEKFLKEVLSLAGIETDVTSDVAEGLSLTLTTEDSLVLGHRGETLDALQYLTSLAVNTSPGKFTRVSLDALGYRARRVETLQRMAGKMADKCIRQNRRVSLEPMNSADRKEIHAYLNEVGGVVTKSEGYEPNRRIVIYPAK